MLCSAVRVIQVCLKRKILGASGVLFVFLALAHRQKARLGSLSSSYFARRRSSMSDGFEDTVDTAGYKMKLGLMVAVSAINNCKTETCRSSCQVVVSRHNGGAPQ